MIRTAEFASIEIRSLSSVDYRETHEIIGGFHTRRMQSGTLDVQQHWSKLRVQMSGLGWIPIGLSALAFPSSGILKCGAPVAIQSASNIINLPSARRSEPSYLPIGFGLVGNQRISTPVTMDGDQATLTIVPPDNEYMVWYWPEITATAFPPRQQFDRGLGQWTWSMSLEEN
jgi:hypothetical protein